MIVKTMLEIHIALTYVFFYATNYANQDKSMFAVIWAFGCLVITKHYFPRLLTLIEMKKKRKKNRKVKPRNPYVEIARKRISAGFMKPRNKKRKNRNSWRKDLEKLINDSE